MAFVRAQSFYEFLCEGDATRLPEGATEVPRSILEQFPVTVHDRSLIQVPGPSMQRNICDRIINNRNCDKLSNCPHIHPDFIAERWVVPDLLCHKWFQGTCGYGDRCWNQHGETFDRALALAIQTQQGLRREMPPFLYDPGAAGGSIRQVDREEARRYIKATLMQFRMSTIKKWHFGTGWTTYYEYASFAPSDLARRVWEEEMARRNLRDRSPTGRGRGLSPRRSERRHPSRPSYTWTNRRSTTPPRASFPPTARSPTPSRTTTPPAKPFFDGPSMETESDASSAPRFGAAAFSSRQGDVGERGRATPTVAPSHRDPSPSQRWLDQQQPSPMIVEVDENNPEHTNTATSRRVLDDDDLWNAAEDELRADRAARQVNPEAFDPWHDSDEVVNQDIPASARPASTATSVIPVKAMPKQPKQPPIMLNLDSTGNQSFTVTVSPEVFRSPEFPHRVTMSAPMTNPVHTAIPPTISSRPSSEPDPNAVVLREPFNIDGFRLAWPADQFRSKGPTALDGVRWEAPVSEIPQFGFITTRRFTGFPVLSMSLPPLTRLGANNVSMLPPGNHPYAAFAPDAPWEISYDGVLYLDQVLNSPTIRSTLTPFGLFVDFPVYHNSQRTLEERVLFLGVPNNFHDPQTTLIYSMVWHTITASLSELHHTSVEARFDRLRGWCLFAVDVHRVSVNYSYINWISTFMRLIGDAIIDCAGATLPPNMRTYFAGHPDMAPYFTAEPPNFVLRRKR